MRRPAARRTATTPPPVPAPDVMAGMEFLDLPGPRGGEERLPAVSVQGIDPRPSRALVPRLSLVLEPAAHAARPDSVEELLDRVPPGWATVARLAFDVRPLRDVLEARLGWNGLAQLVADPSDTATNAAFRAALAGGTPDRATTGLLEDGDLDADVCVIDGDDTVVVGQRHELGRARLALVPLLAGSARLTRRLAETLGRPRDGAGRRCLEETMARLVADTPLDALLLRLRGAPHCAVPGAWSTGPAGPTGPAR